jgi:glycosyltransferase involved in cell wall biosynthesis
VAMEAMACGVPTYVSNNTGQRDLIELLGAGIISNQRPVKAPPSVESVDGWGESDLEEIVDILETVYTQASSARLRALDSVEKIKTWDWSLQNDRLFDCVYAKNL